MALSPATGLANYSAGISSSVLHVDSNSDRVGIGTTNPQDTLQVGTAITMGSGAVTATQGNFQNVSIAGTLTYEDVSSIDAVGIITAQSGITITGGGLSVVGDTDLVGNLTGVNATGISSIANVTGTTLNVTGVTTIANTVVGGATTQLVVNGNARITGILTMGTSSITLDGTQNKIISGKYDFLGISTSHNDTAVDVFVYDTSKDSDGGEWRKKTSHTSWYNETLNTATRGSRKEFPAVAVIVAETTKVTIYDGDDPDLPMWMVFNGGLGSTSADSTFLGTLNANPISSVLMLNGVLCVGFSSSGGWGVSEIGFVSDSQRWWWLTGTYKQSLNSIDERNVGNQYIAVDTSTSVRLINAIVNDVAMTVLSNAPVDSATGLPVPTIAVATNGGTSVIRDDGSVADLTGFNPITTVHIDESNVIATSNSGTPSNDFIFKTHIPSSNEAYNAGITAGSYNYYMNSSSITIPLLRDIDMTSSAYNSKDDITYRGGTGGVDYINAAEAISNVSTTSAIAYISKDYNTGYMAGDIKLATLSSNVGAAITFTNLSTNGDLADSSDLTSWTAYNATLTHQTDAMRVADNGDFTKAYQSFTTVDGRKYIASVNCKTLSGSDAVFSIGNAGPAANSWNNNGTVQESTTGIKSLVFTASGTTNYVELGSTGGGYAEYQNVRIDEVKVEDRSVNDNPLEVYGTVTKSAVATGADLVGYSGFNINNYLLQPDNNDLNFGTGDLHMIFWHKKTDNATNEVLFQKLDFTTGSNGASIAFQHNTNNYYCYLIGGTGGPNGTNDYLTGAFVTDGNWHCVAGVRSGGTLTIYVDGKNVGSGVRNYNVNNTGNLIIGSYSTAGTATAQTSTMALLRIGGTAPSAEQIKKIYEDEKFLFQENSQATLYGSSDAVTALSYDEVTDQLHVGTSSGRSDFQGLRRINNTTVGITSAISAHDSFIIEQ